MEVTADVTAPAKQVDTPKQITGSPSKFVEGLKWAISFPAMLGMFLIGRVFYEGRGFVVDPDVWWHIKVGQDILRTHHFPTVDPYSFTAAGTPWIAYEWLGEIVVGVDVSLGRSRFAVRISDRLRQHHYCFAVLAGNGAIGEFKSRLHIGAVPGIAGIRIVYSAAANVWLPVSDSDAAGDGEISPGSFLAVVDTAADFSGRG